MFWHRCLDIIDRGLKETELRAFYRDTRWQETCMTPALRKVRALTRGEVDETDTGEAAFRLLSELTVTLPQLSELLQARGAWEACVLQPRRIVPVALPPQGVTLWDVESVFEDHLRQLVGWAVYSFVAAVEVRSLLHAPT